MVIVRVQSSCPDAEIVVVGDASWFSFLRENRDVPLICRIGNTIFAFLLSFYSGRRTTDTTTGLRVFSAHLLPVVESLPDGLDFDTATPTFLRFNNCAWSISKYA